MGLALAGCAGRPTGNLIPVADGGAPGASKVDLLVATTRSDVGAAPGVLFTGARGPLSYADIVVSIPPDSQRQAGEIQWPEHPPGDPARNFVTRRADMIGGAAARAKIARAAAAHGGRVLLFVHGYNTRFEEAVYRLAQISHDSRAAAQPVLFTWPSRGRLLSYGYDRESANYSRDALEAVLHELAATPQVKAISILAHSMGNWVTMEALRQMAIRDRRIEPKIDSVVLAAPDLDIDVFRTQIVAIGEKRPPFVLFTSRNDRALRVAGALYGSQPRLGEIDPNLEPYRADLARERIQAIDLSNAKSGDSFNHATFAENPEVVRLIGARLLSGQAIEDNRESVGDRLGQVFAGAATTVGSAASLAVSAPVAIVDPDTREGLGDQFNGIGEGVRTTASAPFQR